MYYIHCALDPCVELYRVSLNETRDLPFTIELEPPRVSLEPLSQQLPPTCRTSHSWNRAQCLRLINYYYNLTLLLLSTKLSVDSKKEIKNKFDTLLPKHSQLL